jgi:hypothetical protein
MNAKDLSESLEYLTKAELTPFIWGHAGVGKSSIVRQYAESKGFHFFAFYLGTQSDIGDVLGLAEFVDNGDGTKSTAFATPKWLKDTIEYCEGNPDSGAVIFLDEFNRARRDILSGMFSLALDKTFHTIKLPKNCHIIAAGNPPTDEYFTTDVNETALMARFVHIKLEPTFQEWIDYAKGTEIDSSLVGWLKSQPDLLEEKHTSFDLKKMVKPDRRAISRLDKLFKLKTPRHLLEQLMHGIIGLERTVAYLQYLNEQDKPLTAKEILSGKKLDLIKKWSNPTDIVASCLNLSCDALKEEVTQRNADNKNFTAKEKENLMDFIREIPKDISFPFFLSQAPIGTNPALKDFTLDSKYEKELTDILRAARPPAEKAKE